MSSVNTHSVDQTKFVKAKEKDIYRYYSDNGKNDPILRTAIVTKHATAEQIWSNIESQFTSMIQDTSTSSTNNLNLY